MHPAVIINIRAGTNIQFSSLLYSSRLFTHFLPSYSFLPYFFYAMILVFLGLELSFYFSLFHFITQ